MSSTETLKRLCLGSIRGVCLDKSGASVSGQAAKWKAPLHGQQPYLAFTTCSYGGGGVLQ